MQRARVVRAGRGPPDRRCASGAGIPAPVDAAAAVQRPFQSRASPLSAANATGAVLYLILGRYSVRGYAATRKKNKL